MVTLSEACRSSPSDAAAIALLPAICTGSSRLQALDAQLLLSPASRPVSMMLCRVMGSAVASPQQQ
jgi:hypothetical protein